MFSHVETEREPKISTQAMGTPTFHDVASLRLRSSQKRPAIPRTKTTVAIVGDIMLCLSHPYLTHQRLTSLCTAGPGKHFASVCRPFPKSGWDGRTRESLFCVAREGEHTSETQ